MFNGFDMPWHHIEIILCIKLLSSNGYCGHISLYAQTVVIRGRLAKGPKAEIRRKQDRTKDSIHVTGNARNWYQLAQAPNCDESFLLLPVIDYFRRISVISSNIYKIHCSE
jgi:hypothetical protein